MAPAREKRSRNDDNEVGGIKLPAQVLEKINAKTYDEDDERFSQFNNKKRKKAAPQISRKQQRKQERELKKQKKSQRKPLKANDQPHKTKSPQDLQQQSTTSRKPATVKPQQSSKDAEHDDPIAALMALKKSKGGSKANSGIRMVKEDDLDDDLSENDFDEIDDGEDDFDDGDENSENSENDFSGFDDENIDDMENDDEIDSDDFDDEFAEDLDEDDESDPLAKLKALKEAKNKKQATSSGTDEKLSKKTSSKKSQDVEPQFVLPKSREDDDLDYYAKKLGLKKGKRSKLSKENDDDIIGGLLDGLDFDYLDEPETPAPKEKSTEKNTSKDNSELPFGSDDEISEGDFDTDVESGFESESDDDEPKVKENPYVAPVQDKNLASEDEQNDSDNDGAPKKYIPPALRRKLALESSSVSPEIVALQKSIKGPLNRLSETNIGGIVNELNGLYTSHPRHNVTENLVSIILDSIIQQGRLLDTFVYLHAASVVAIYRLQGADFGAYLIQTLVEKLERFHQESSKGKETSNLISLLSSVYMFQLVSSKLLYDIIKSLINEFNEGNAELLVRLIRSSGNQMRSDDPSALKEIVLLINKKANTLSSEQLNTRTQFLIETITSLKNNKLKINNESSHQLTIRLKKFLATINNNKFNDPIQVSLDDIHNINTRGKWWLVGSAWKGHDTKSGEPEVNVNEDALNDILDNAEPNWMELARMQRMNTDIRRAIFVSIMSANDYVDSLTKLDKLALKRSQEREIPRVLIHCTSVEPAWNPYYGILAAKLCDSHNHRKTFQFMLWDLFKEFEGNNENDSENEDFMGFDNNDEDEETRLKRILNLGRFFGFLLAEGSLPLHVLKTVNFLTASNDCKLTLEVLFVTFLDHIAKKSQANAVGTGLKSHLKTHGQKFDDRLLIERILKAREQQSLLRGTQYFLNEKVRDSDFINGKKQKKRIEWGVNAVHDIIDEILKEPTI